MVCRVRMSGWICRHWWDGSAVTWAPWAEQAGNCGMSLMKNSAVTRPVPLTHAERLILGKRRSAWPTFPRLPLCHVGRGGREARGEWADGCADCQWARLHGGLRESAPAVERRYISAHRDSNGQALPQSSVSDPLNVAPHPRWLLQLSSSSSSSLHCSAVLLSSSCNLCNQA